MLIGAAAAGAAGEGAASAPANGAESWVAGVADARSSTPASTVLVRPAAFPWCPLPGRPFAASPFPWGSFPWVSPLEAAEATFPSAAAGASAPRFSAGGAAAASVDAAPRAWIRILGLAVGRGDASADARRLAGSRRSRPRGSTTFGFVGFEPRVGSAFAASSGAAFAESAASSESWGCSIAAFLAFAAPTRACRRARFLGVAVALALGRRGFGARRARPAPTPPPAVPPPRRRSLSLSFLGFASRLSWESSSARFGARVAGASARAPPRRSSKGDSAEARDDRSPRGPSARESVWGWRESIRTPSLAHARSQTQARRGRSTRRAVTRGVSIGWARAGGARAPLYVVSLPGRFFRLARPTRQTLPVGAKSAAGRQQFPSGIFRSTSHRVVPSSPAAPRFAMPPSNADSKTNPSQTPPAIQRRWFDAPEYQTGTLRHPNENDLSAEESW